MPRVQNITALESEEKYYLSAKAEPISMPVEGGIMTVCNHFCQINQISFLLFISISSGTKKKLTVTADSTSLTTWGNHEHPKPNTYPIPKVVVSGPRYVIKLCGWCSKPVSKHKMTGIETGNGFLPVFIQLKTMSSRKQNTNRENG